MPIELHNIVCDAYIEDSFKMKQNQAFSFISYQTNKDYSQ